MTSCDKLSKNYYNYFLGQKDDLDNKKVFNYFDINYLPIKNLPIAYYSMNNSNLAKLKNLLNIESQSLVTDVLVKLNDLMNSNDNNFNNYNIYTMTIILIIFLILVIISLLRLIQFNYPLYYIYILIGIIIIILLITSLWFLYVNTSLL